MPINHVTVSFTNVSWLLGGLRTRDCTNAVALNAGEGAIGQK